MSQPIRIGLIGDYNPAITAHRAIPIALTAGAAELGMQVHQEWIGTEEIGSRSRVADFHALWCTPGSPYRHMDGALLAIQHARESNIAFLGTCGGFQHAIIEYARNVMGWLDAGHGETPPDNGRLVITPMSCALIEQGASVHLQAGSRIARAYQRLDIFEEYHCSYAIDAGFEAHLTSPPLRISGRDARGDTRAIELDDHPFFVAALFQPERAALRQITPPLVRAFIAAAKG
jgi:CTP synthase (UTP-ammonia lyase)